MHSFNSSDGAWWTLWGPYYDFNEAPTLEGEGSTTCTVAHALYRLDALGSSVWWNGKRLGQLDTDGDFALLEGAILAARC